MSSGFGSSDQLSRRVTELERKLRQQSAATGAGNIASMGSVSLAASPATSTVKTDAAVTSASIILPVASNANGWSVDAGITGITPAAGSFTVSHTASALTRTFSYIVINPA